MSFQVKRGDSAKTYISQTSEVVAFRFVPGVLVCVFAPDRVGGAFVLGVNEQHELQGKLNELLSGLSSTNIEPSELKAKILGAAGQVAHVASAVRERGVQVESETVVKGIETEIFFYPKDGRLRVSAIALQSSRTAPMPASNPTPTLETKKKRILIVDDSATICRLLTRVFETESDFEVIGTIQNPLEVERAVRELKPDVMTLDIHMPGLDGCAVLEQVLPKHPIPTVMISSLSMAEGNMVLRALELGAVDYVQKPSMAEMKNTAAAIVEKVRTAAGVNVRLRGVRRTNVVRPAEKRKWTAGRIIAIGSSTGGTEALKDVFLSLPENIPPIVVVQHIPPVFSKAFAMRLNELCPFEVKEAEDGDEVRPNRVLIAPGGLNMSIVPKATGLVVQITDSAPVNRHKPSVDVLFDSVAKHVGKNAVGVILTGMGADGARGMLEMRKAGARTLAQDEASSVVYGMPKEAARIGAAEQIVSLDRMAESILEMVRLLESAGSQRHEPDKSRG